MKRLSIAFIALALAASSCAPKAQISGKLYGIEGDTLLVAYNSDSGSGINVIDTVVLDGGKFSYNPRVAETGVALLIDRAHFVDFITLYIVPGENCVIEGTMTDYTISGSKFYRDWGEFHNSIADINAEKTALLHELETRGDDPEFDYHGGEQKIAEKTDSAAFQYIKAHPDSDMSAYLATEVRLKLFERAESLLSERAKEGPLAGKLDSRRAAIIGDQVRREAMGKIAEGVEAPDFTLPTSDGDSFTLSEHRGHYVLLDFWGTWCHWCCEGIPTIKEIYQTYGTRLLIVSVDTGDPESAWRDGIKQYGMDWIQVYNSKDDAVEARYAVEGFPGFYLIDPEGKIKMISYGEPHDFVKKIGELIAE